MKSDGLELTSAGSAISGLVFVLLISRFESNRRIQQCLFERGTLDTVSSNKRRFIRFSVRKIVKTKAQNPFQTGASNVFVRLDIGNGKKAQYMGTYGTKNYH